MSLALEIVGIAFGIETVRLTHVTLHLRVLGFQSIRSTPCAAFFGSPLLSAAAW